MSYFKRFVFLLALGLVAIGCLTACGPVENSNNNSDGGVETFTPDTPPKACQSSTDCPGGSNCEDGACTAVPTDGGATVERPNCEPGSVGCRCIAGGACDAGLRCDEGTCQVCEEGTVGCGCKSDKSCDNGLRCEEGVCQGCTGKDKCPCYGNGNCDAGFVCADSSSGIQLCRACKGEEEGCNCTKDNDCGNKLLCVNKRCIDAAKANQVPKRPVCYYPCEDDVKLDDGTIRVCHPEYKLYEGCPSGRTCHLGSCLTQAEVTEDKSTAYPYCVGDSNCPTWQSCVHGRCYSTCTSTSDCPSGFGCHAYVCRRECNVKANTCTGNTACITKGSDEGFCMPKSTTYKTTKPPAQVAGTFTIPFHNLTFSNTLTEQQLVIINKSKFSADFSISRVRDTTQASKPLSWIKFDKCKVYSEDGKSCKTFEGKATGTEPYELKNLQPNNMVIVRLVNAGGKPSSVGAYNGTLQVKNTNMGVQDVNLAYNESVGGQWKGTMVAFGNYDDTHIDKFPAASSLNIQLIRNALLRRWMNFKRNQLDLDKFIALLRSVREGSWNQQRVKDLCKKGEGSADVLCYPYSSSKGYEVLSFSQREAPAPSGTSELKFVMNVKEKSGNVLEGRIDTSQTLQYSGNPKIRLQFDSKPGSAKTVFLNSLTANIDIGGRFYIGKNKTCPDSTNFDKVTIPWLLPDFQAMSTAAAGLLRERFECRNKTTPQTAPAGASSKQVEAVQDSNKALSSANPVPNGWRLRRSLELIDGAIIQNQYIFILYRERFVSFFNTQSSGSTALNNDFVSYGYILMTRYPTELSDEEYVGSTPPAATQCKTDSACSGGRVCRSGECRIPNKLSQVQCTPEIVKEATGQIIQTHDSLRLWSSTKLGDLVSALLGNQTDSAGKDSSMQIRGVAKNGIVEYSYQNNGTTYYVHYLCEDTKQFNGGLTTNPTDCPLGSKVTYFVAPITEASMRSHDCQKAKDCHLRFQQLSTTSDFTRDIPYRCANKEELSCDKNRKNMREGKVFFKPTGNKFVSKFASLRNAMYQAFRYRIKFRSRSGQNVGFTPTVCSANVSSLTPYCYDPVAIEKLESRVNCLEAILADSHLSQKVSSTSLSDIQKFLVQAFSYSNSQSGSSIVTDPGFEMLNAELKVMLGDEAFTRSFASRYDLAQSNLVSFQGSLFEANGINLSGALGYEMYNLYLSTQYYQLVLDRFFSQTDLIYASFKGSNSFITAKSVTSYFQKLLLASTRKARSWSHIATRYHQLNRSDLAKRVVERAYTATYIEMTILTRLLRELMRVIDPKEMSQVSSEISKIALTYKEALLVMEETYKKLSQDLNHFGLPTGYIPFPAMDSFSALTGSTNAFQVSLNFAKEKMYIARNKEQGALQTKRSFDTSAASFQNELVRIEQNYENQLLEICGGITVTDADGKQRTYPAIPRYATLSEKYRKSGNPCGKVAGGSLYNSLLELEKMRINIMSLQKSQESMRTQIKLEEDRIKKYCDAKFKLADITWKYREKTNNLQLELEETQRNIEQTIRVAQTLSQAAEMVKCSIIIGTANGGDCPTALIGIGLVLGIGVVQEATIRGLESKVVEKRTEQTVLEQQLERTQLQFECRACDVADPTCKKEGTAQVESKIRVKEFASQLMNLNYEALKARLDMQIASSNVIRLQQRARRLMTQQDEATQLAINVQAAQNDPNVRIYKNDAIISAERTFQDAMKEAYRATLIYEYYTGQSYKHKGSLYLIRMVSYGDKNLENYLSQLEQAFREFEELNGKPDVRVMVVSLVDDILKIPRLDENQTPRSTDARAADLIKALSDPSRLTEEGYISFPFTISVAKKLSRVSPVTYNHKILYIEADISVSGTVDEVARLYLRQSGTGMIRLQGDDIKYVSLPQRTAVINPTFNGHKTFTQEIYRNFRLRDRPLGNTQWELLFNQVSEKVNQDLKLNTITDITLHIYYTDFTEEK